MVLMTTLCGRAAELTWLEDALRRATGGSPTAVLLHGPAGIGKTTLLRTFVDAHPGVRTTWLSAVPSESTIPYGVVEVLRGEQPDPAADQFQVGAEIIATIGALTGPTILVVDDLQWADGSSVAALQFALRRLRAEPVLVVLTCREPDLLPADVRRSLSAYGAALALSGLGADDLDALAGGLLPSSVLERLQAQTEGNPLHARALLEEYGAALRDAVEDRPLPVPRSYAEVVLAQLAALPPETVRVVRAAAVLGLRGPVARVAAVAGTDPDDLCPAVAAAADLLGVAVGTVSFRHPLVQAAVYHDVPGAELAALHRRAASVTDGLESVGHRVAASPAGDPVLAGEVAEHAAAAALRGDHAAAASLFATAERLCDSPAARDTYLLHRLDAAIRGQDAVTVAELARRAEALPAAPLRDLVLGGLASHRGDRASCISLLERAHAACAHPADDQLAARIAGTLAVETLNDGSSASCIAWSTTALEYPSPSPVRALPRFLLAQGHAQLGDLAAGLASVEELAAKPVLATPEDLGARLGRGIVRLWADDPLGAAEDLHSVERRAADIGPLYVRLVALVYAADASYRTGDWNRASTSAELAASLAGSSGDMTLVAFAHAYATACAAGRGEWDAATRHLDAARAASEVLSDIASTAWTSLAAARLAHARGDRAGLLEALGPWWMMREHPGVMEPGIARWTDLYAEALTAGGDLDAADEVLLLAERLADDRGHASGRAALSRARASWLVATSAPASAIESRFTAALVDHGLEAVLGRLAYGSWLRATGRTARAVRQLRDAYGRAEALGAQPYLQRCAEELAACGQPASPVVDVRSLLTAHELGVATLVASGLSNREVAHHLVVSTKTVEYHLGNIYRKTGLANRATLAATLTRTAHG